MLCSMVPRQGHLLKGGRCSRKGVIQGGRKGKKGGRRRWWLRRGG